MPLTYSERVDLVTNSEFRKRVRFALWVSAAAIMADTQKSDSHAWAARSLQGAPSERDITIAAIDCAVSARVGPAGLDASDADIQSVVDMSAQTIAALR